MLIGRDRELEVVSGAIAAGHAVVIVGPAGIGKTTLARAALCASGSFREGGALATLAWSPLLVFRRLLRSEPPELPDEVAGAVLQEDSTPVLLDDLQWADDASLEVVGRLVSQLPVVTTVRTGEDRSDEVIEALTLVGALRLDLGGIDDVSAAKLADTLHPGLGPTERDHLLQMADGNPLLLDQLLDGATAAPTLVSALLGRVGSLSAAGQQAMHRLAVLGRAADQMLLGAGADELVGVGVATRADDRYAMVHSLLSEVVVEGLGARADDIRRELAAKVPDAEGAFLLAAAGERESARALALRAAHDGDRRLRANLLALAVACADDTDAPNRVRAARLFSSLSEPARARELCAVDGIEDLSPVDRGSLRAATAEAAWLQGQQAESIELAEQALVDLRGTRTSYEVAVMAGSTVAQTWIDLDGRPALERAREAVRLADEIGAEQAYARTRLASVLMTSGEPGWAEIYQEVIDLAGAADDDDLRRTAVVSLILGTWAHGDPIAAARVARAELDRGPRQAFDITWLTISAYAAIVGLIAGRPREELVDEFRPHLERWPSFRSRAFMHAAVTLALADAGRHTAAADLVAGAADGEGVDLQAQVLARWAATDALWLAGRLEATITSAAAMAPLGMADYPPAIHARLVSAHASRELGRVVEGPAPTSGLPAWAAAPIEWTALCQATAGDPAGAIDGFLAAAEGWAGNDVRSEARCRWAAGDEAARICRSDAVELLDAAASVAASYGGAAMGERIRRSLRGAGVIRRSTVTTGLGGLTEREVQVLDLVGSGMHSADVAAALAIKSSTVESLVRSAMQKLGTGTRVAAAARLDQLRAAEPISDPQPKMP